MKAVGKYLFLLGLIATSPLANAAGNEADERGIYRGPSLDGVTGLLNMNLPYTMGAGMTLYVGGTYEDALPGVYQSLASAVAALRIGFGENVEIGVKTKGYSINPYVGRIERGAGDSEVMLKWKFREQNENLPAMAMGFGLILPTGDEKLGFTEVENGGGKFSLTAAAEMPMFEDGYLGLYGEAQFFAMDKVGGDTAYSDIYSITNLGIAFPLSDANHLSAFVEYSKVNKKIPLIQRNHTAVTPGFRLAYDNFSLSLAAQSIDFEGIAETQRRFVGSLSLGF